MPPKKTLQQFIKDARKIHGKQYDYSLVHYQGDNKRIKIICSKHGEFLQSVNTHLQGSGCSACGYQRNSDRSLKGKYTTDIKVGDRFGHFVVIKPNVKSNKWKHRRSFVKCDCGLKYSLRTRDFVTGLIKKCKRCKRYEALIKPVIGTKYGDWIVISEEMRKKYHNTFKVRCKCGHEAFKSHVALRAGDSKMCIVCAKKMLRKRVFTGIEELTGSYIGSIKAGCKRSKNRTLEFTVTKEFLWSLFLKQKRKCALSGVDIVMHFNRRNQTASLDRINSFKGYTKDNVQWIHKIVNNMKQDQSDESFIQWCQLISKYNEK